jgi:hypothetical protein
MKNSICLPGVEIVITVNGTALRELEDPYGTDDERIVSCYIEVVSGQVFEVFINILPEFEYKGDGISFEVLADGESIESPVIEPNLIQDHICERAILGSGKSKDLDLQHSPQLRSHSLLNAANAHI